ncbi:MAG TPA: hypothetical protein VFQ45_01295, partial [Longimicrobium sp.]|nr:hypothetical protein [Longimicrobium sp.]
MLFSVRLHDAVDPDTVLRRLLPALAGARGERRVAYAQYDAERAVLSRRWSAAPEGRVDEAAVELEPQRLNTLLLDDAGGDRPLRPADAAPAWALRDLIPGLEPDKSWVRVRAIAHDGALLGVLVVAEPRRLLQARKGDGPVAAAGDVLEMALARAIAAAAEKGPMRPSPFADAAVERLHESERAVAAARDELAQVRARIEALERAAAGATELLMDAHVELDR